MLFLFLKDIYEKGRGGWVDECRGKGGGGCSKEKGMLNENFKTIEKK